MIDAHCSPGPTMSSNNLSGTAQRLLEATSGAVGEDMFVAMARAITEVLGARWGFIGEMISSTRVCTRGGWTAGASIPSIEYDLEGTPCAEVIWKDACAYPSGVQQQFPDDHMLVEMGVESYFGVPVFGSRGTAIGVIVALHDQPLHVAEYRDVLFLFAMRVGAEIERERAERLLRQHDRLESLGMLAGGVARDFNNLLTTIMGNIGLAQMQLGNRPQQEVAALLHEVDGAAKAAADLTRQLLAFSGSSERRRDCVDFCALVRETAKMVEPLLPEQAHLRLDLPPFLPLVLGDMTQLRQVVMSLIRNAGDALIGRKGVIRVSGAIAAASASGYDRTTMQAERFDAQKAHFALTVTDTGAGMDAQALANLFVPLFSTKENRQGFGLAITAGIVDKHDGAIEVGSTAGEGTAITIYLPIANETCGAPPSTDGAAAPFAGTRILVADDDPAVRKLLTRTLEGLGCSVTQAADGDAALAAITQQPRQLDCAVLDINMPGAGGDDIAMALHGEHHGVPIVLSSGLSTEQLDEYLRSGTIAATLAKPWQTDDLITALRAALPTTACTR